MIRLIRSIKPDYDKEKKSSMRFHTIDLRLIGEWSKTNHFSIEQKKSVGLKTYGNLLKEIFNNIGKSLSDLLLKHMDLMNTVHRENYNKSYIIQDNILFQSF